MNRSRLRRNPRSQGATTGYTLWDDEDQSLAGIVPLGLYNYRVVVTDAAGNISQSGEYRPITIKVR